MRLMPPAIARPAFACALLLLSACASRPVAEAPAVVEPTPAAQPGTSDSAVGTYVVVADAPPDTPAAEVVTATDATAEAPPAPTQAELDFAALYGGDVYDPVADPTLPAPAQLPVSYDPWEGFNRRMHAVNTVIDTRIARPLANAYMEVVPRPIRLGVGNFFRNLGQPVSAINALLQGVQLVDVRTQLLALDSMLEGAPDEYALLRDAWLQRRNYQIHGDRAAADDDSLPDYLREEQLPTVPVDAMPVLPEGG